MLRCRAELFIKPDTPLRCVCPDVVNDSPTSCQYALGSVEKWAVPMALAKNIRTLPVCITRSRSAQRLPAMEGQNPANEDDAKLLRAMK